MIGIGIDIVEVPRVQRRLGELEGLVEQLFTTKERKFCDAQRWPGSHYAACFAAKEAFMKAIGIGLQDGSLFSEIEIINRVTGQPQLVLHGNLRSRFELDGAMSCHLSLTRTKELACAVVTLEQKGVR